MVKLRALESEWSANYVFQLKPVSLDLIDILEAKLRDAEEQLMETETKLRGVEDRLATTETKLRVVDRGAGGECHEGAEEVVHLHAVSTSRS